jgi:hypothetical protein
LFSRVQEHGGGQMIPFSCVLEKNLSDMPPDEAAKYCEANNVQRYVQCICLTAIKSINVKLLCKYICGFEKTEDFYLYMKH